MPGREHGKLKSLVPTNDFMTTTPEQRKRAARAIASAITKNLEHNLSDEQIAAIAAQQNIVSNAKAALARVCIETGRRFTGQS